MLQDDIATTIRTLLSEIAADKKIDLIEHEAVVDHVHLLLRVADRRSLSRAMNNLKGVSARRVFQRFPDLKMDAHTNSFWQARYGAKEFPETAAENISSYIRTQWERLEDYQR